MKTYGIIYAAVGMASMLPFASCSTVRHPVQVSDRETLCGGYTPFRPLSDTEREMFDRLVAGIGDRKLEAEKVATQVVNGTNYRFVAGSSRDGRVYVTIYCPLPGNGDPVISGIEKAER